MARFASVTDEQIEKLLAEKNSKNTHQATASVRNVFMAYLKQKRF